MGYVYVAAAPNPTDPCVHGPAGWNPLWAFPGPPWAPGWPVAVAAGFTLGLSLGAVSVGAAAALAANVLFASLDDATLACHSMQITALLGTATLQVSLDGSTFSNSVNANVKNYSGAHYGINPNLYLNLNSGNMGQSGSVTVCVVSTNPPICATVNFTVASTVQRGYELGSDVEEYLASANTWTDKTSGSQDSGGAFGLGAFAYVFGGNSNITNTNRFDPQGNAWASKAALATGRKYGVGCTVGTLGYVFGGSIAAGNASITESDEYNDGSNSWTTKTALTQKRSRSAAAPVGLFAYVLGGAFDFNSSVMLQNTDEFSQAGNSWASKSNILPAAMCYMSACAIGSAVYAFGGSSGDFSGSSTVYANASQFNPLTNTWAALTALPTARYQSDCCAIGTAAYIYAGKYVFASSITDNQQYTPLTNAFVTKAALLFNSNSYQGCAVTS